MFFALFLGAMLRVGAVKSVVSKLLDLLLYHASALDSSVLKGGVDK